MNCNNKYFWRHGFAKGVTTHRFRTPEFKYSEKESMSSRNYKKGVYEGYEAVESKECKAAAEMAQHWSVDVSIFSHIVELSHH